MKYKSRGLRKRGDNSWQTHISHADPLTGEQVTFYHTIKATSERQAKENRESFAGIDPVLHRRARRDDRGSEESVVKTSVFIHWDILSQ